MNYEEKMLEHVEGLFSALYSTLTEPLVRRVIRCGILRAERHGFVQEDNVCLFIDMMFTYGRDFEVTMPWARKVLQDSSLTSSSERAEMLYSAAVEHLHLAREITREEAALAETS